MIDKEKINTWYEYCIVEFNKLNSKQISTLWKYLKMLNGSGKYELLPKSIAKHACLDYFIKLKNNESGDYDAVVYDIFVRIWTFILGMLMMQDEYNLYNKNYTPKVR